MLIEFSVGNYRSFKDVVTFSMVAAPIEHENEEIDQNNIFAATKEINLLKSTVIYGANASGKSNLIRAISFMRNFVFDSAIGKRVDNPINTEPYKLSNDLEGQTSYFEVVFLIGNIRYRYGFEVDLQTVKSEWLYQTSTNKEVKLFSREHKNIEISSKFKEGKSLENKTRRDALFLSVVSQFDGNISIQIVTWFRQVYIISNIDEEDEWRGLTDVLFFDKHWYQEKLVSLITSLDLGIKDLEVVETPNTNIEGSHSRSVNTTHWKYDGTGKKISLEKFDIVKEESAGTQKLYRLSGLLINLLDVGGILIIDELDARLHPLITCAIVKLFNSFKTNLNNAQLIFTTHDANLLSYNLFRKDQIWFTEKNRYGATDLYSLVEYKIPDNTTFEQDYIAGRYGAVPFIGDLNRVLGK